MAPPKKAKTAFLYFQTEKLAGIKKEMGGSMGVAMTELSARWKKLAKEEKQKYLDMEKQDKKRYKRESLEADRKAFERQEAKRLEQQRLDEAIVYGGGDPDNQNNNGDDNNRSVHQSRGARQKVDQERERKKDERMKRKRAREDEIDPEVLQERKRIKQKKKRETEERQRKRAAEERAMTKQHNKLDKEAAKKQANRLDYLLKQSSIFAKLKMGGEHQQQQKGANEAKVHHGRDHVDDDEDEDLEMEEEDESDRHVFLTNQPSCIKHGKLKPYQIESLNWMIHLAEKGLNGILADEMGLGKTLQSISILAYHYEYLKIQGPHLICVPKSTLSNWMNELKRWCPSLRALRFHGSKEDRQALVDNYFTTEAACHDGRRPIDLPQIMDEKGELIDDNSNNPRAWDVCVTTYEVCNTERKTLQKFTWKYLVIDEAHRLKNDASMFSKTVRTFRTSNRLLLTGTPLQNNLRELWALLNFLLPDIFASAEQFDEWFNLEIEDEEAKKQMISQLHKVLRPFMLRRLKADVAKGLPPKTETIIMVGMSRMQKQLYKKLLLRDLDSITGPSTGKNRTAVLNIVMQLRKCCGHPYLFEGVEDRTLDPLGEHLVENCGKLSMVDKLLKKLKERGSRVLIFTQMTRVLDILEDFMLMRQFQYCRIDGNTVHEDREAAIDNFNSPGSEKFCFILSTRAGGLGINLQTADTCILYDSDWNPQQDLQAQDRCHRLGQKKPVNVYRLVSENTVEEKIVERAQQKLKLDAMVVQQGRLKEKDKVTKDEIMAAVRFGADTVFRSEESTITDDDIDVILERGAARTKELAEKLQKADKGDLLDFRLDGGISAQTFEGVDYSDKELRDHLRMLAANSMGKRERRPPPTSYNPIIHSKKSMIVNNRRIKLPKSLRLPSMEDHHFYNRERLLELGKLEFETYATLRELGQLPPKDYIEKQRTLLPPELAQEKLELLDEGFGEWTRSQYYHFVKACAKFGRDDIASIAADMDMPEESVAPYSKSFWEYGPSELKGEWDRVVANIERGEKKIAKRKKLSSLLTQFISTFDNPRNEMVFANKGTTHFALEQDRALLCAVDEHGYGNWDSVREEIRKDERLKFQHTVQGMTTLMIGKRCDYRMRQMEKELEAREKVLKNKCPPNVIAAQKIIDSIKEVDTWESTAMNMELKGEETPSHDKLSEDARMVIEERLSDKKVCIDRLREIEVQLHRCKAVAEETRQAILRGDQYVNYSNITLKAGGPSCAGGKDDNFGTFGDDGDIEARINSGVLRVPECGQCSNCRDKGNRRSLCVKRLEVRNKLITVESKRLRELQGKGFDKKRIGSVVGSSSTISSGSIGGSSIGSKKRKMGESLAPKKGGGGGGGGGGAKLSNTMSIGSSTKKKAPKLMMKNANGQLKPRVTSQGNKRMSIPDELFPEFCRRIGAAGTGERVNLINQFVNDHPTISVRQVTLKLSEITLRIRPECVPAPEKKGGRAFMFYLRPRYYHILPPEERPDDWERYAEEDEQVFQEEQKKAATMKKQKEEKIKDLMIKDLTLPLSVTSSDKQSSVGSGGSAGGGSSNVGDLDGDGDETEDDEEPETPPKKKSKMK